MRPMPCCALVVLALAACGQTPEAPAPAPSETARAPAPSPAPVAPASASAAASDAGGRAVKEDNDVYEFTYSYPALAGAIPALKAALDGGLDKAKTDLVAEARSDRTAAAKDGYPFHPHSGMTEWKVVTDLPAWLSLSANLYSFSGGAHGNSNFDALIWDKRAGVRRTALDLFVSPAAFRTAVTPRFCQALDRERKKRRGSDYEPNDEMFGKCIDPVKETTVILGSGNGATFDRVGFLIAPYSAGPYAEGSYEVTLPADAAVLRAVKPEYRAAFGPAL